MGLRLEGLFTFLLISLMCCGVLSGSSFSKSMSMGYVETDVASPRSPHLRRLAPPSKNQSVAFAEGAVAAEAFQGKCAAASQDCKQTHGICCDRSLTCFEKNDEVGFCLNFCIPGVHNGDPQAFRTPWTCRTSVAAASQRPQRTTTELPVRVPQPYRPLSPGLALALSMPSEGKVLKFYMYRAQSETLYPLENVNTGNLAGTLWYLQNEVISKTWGEEDGLRFGISRIVRYKVQTKATRPLLAAGLNFGTRIAFDSGMCTGPQCENSKNTYGYYVGCNKLPGYPFPLFPVHYPGAVWYSLFGKCSSRPYSHRLEACEVQEPGGLCEGEPTGTFNCTYSYENDGQITLEELYMSAGLGAEAFWANPNDEAANLRKITAAKALFDRKYGPDLPEPVCDFDLHKFGIMP